MKRGIIILIALIFVMSGIGMAHAKDNELCLSVWSTDIGGATDDPPDSVWCKNQNNGIYYSKGASYVQNSLGAFSTTITWDTDIADGSTKISDLISGGDDTVICSNANVIQLNVHASANNSQFSEGTVYYYQAGNGTTTLADENANTFELTPVPYMKLTATDTDNVGIGCIVAWTLVHWQ